MHHRRGGSLRPEGPSEFFDGCTRTTLCAARCVSNALTVFFCTEAEVIEAGGRGELSRTGVLRRERFRTARVARSSGACVVGQASGQSADERGHGVWGDVCAFDFQFV